MKENDVARTLQQLVEARFIPILQELIKSDVLPPRETSVVLEMAQLLNKGLTELATGKRWGLIQIQNLRDEARRIANGLYAHYCEVLDMTSAI